VCVCVCVCVLCASDHSLSCLYVCVLRHCCLLHRSLLCVCFVCFRPFTVLSVNCVLQTFHCVVCTFVCSDTVAYSKSIHCCVCVCVYVCVCVRVCVCVCVCVCVQVVLTPDHSLCCLQRHGKGVMTWPNKTVYVVSSHDI